MLKDFMYYLNIVRSFNFNKIFHRLLINNKNKNKKSMKFIINNNNSMERKIIYVIFLLTINIFLYLLI